MLNAEDRSLIFQVVMFKSDRAFGRLVERHQSAVRRFFLAHTQGNEMLSDDLAQETFIKAYKSIGSFRMTASFTTWLYRIAYNVFLDEIRRQRDEQPLDRVAHSASHTSEITVQHKVDLYEALNQLNEHERTCVTLQLSEGLSIEDIAAITGMPSGTIKANLSRGKAKMASFLRQNGYE